MWKKFAVGGALAAAIVGIGTASLAESGSTGTTSGTPTLTAATGKGGDGGPLRRLAHLKNALHGSVVTKNPTSRNIVTHDFSHGTVTAVSATSITVAPADHTSQTYAVGSDTKVRERSNGKGSASTISAVKTGDEVYVLGTGSDAFTATLIVDTGH